jgi:hypothetical protein
MKDTNVVSLLNGMDDIQKDTIKLIHTNKAFWDEGVEWDFLNGQQGNHGIYFHDSKVVMMSFDLEGITLSDAIRKFGDPGQVLVLYENLDISVLRIIFIYPKKGICYENTPSWSQVNSSSGKYTIGSSLHIDDIYYFDPSNSADAYDIGCIYPIDESFIQSWHGYGNYFVTQEK